MTRVRLTLKTWMIYLFELRVDKAKGKDYSAFVCDGTKLIVTRETANYRELAQVSVTTWTGSFIDVA